MRLTAVRFYLGEEAFRGKGVDYFCGYFDISRIECKGYDLRIVCRTVIIGLTRFLLPLRTGQYPMQQFSEPCLQLSGILRGKGMGLFQQSHRIQHFNKRVTVQHYNRLDRNTSGLVAAGKSLTGLQELSSLFHDRSLHKFYRCLVNGVIKNEKYIKGYLHKDEKCNKVTVQETETSGALPIETRYRPLGGNGTVTLLEVELITGRTHQIRAHLAGTDHPLIGDYKYGRRTLNDEYRRKYGLKSQLLHAYRLEIPEIEGRLSYLSGKEFTAPLPYLFQKILKEEHVEENK